MKSWLLIIIGIVTAALGIVGVISVNWWLVAMCLVVILAFSFCYGFALRMYTLGYNDGWEARDELPSIIKAAGRLWVPPRKADDVIFPKRGAESWQEPPPTRRPPHYDQPPDDAA
jgi:hypothetical protein